MVSAAARLPASPYRLLPLRGLALAALLHAAVALLTFATAWHIPEEPPVFEVTFALPAPIAPQAALPQPAEPVQPVQPPAPAAAPAPAASEPAAAAPMPDPPQVETAPPRPAAKPAPPPAPGPPEAASPVPDAAPAAALSPAPPSPALLPPAPPAASPVAPPAAPSVPPLQAYAVQLRNLLAVHREYPHAARQRRQEGVVSIALTIDRAGQLAAVRLYEGSLFPLLDEAALAMARRAAPFPPPPLEPHQRQAVFVVPVGFALQE